MKSRTVQMRFPVELLDELAKVVDERGRTAFVLAAVRSALAHRDRARRSRVKARVSRKAPTKTPGV